MDTLHIEKLAVGTALGTKETSHEASSPENVIEISGDERVERDPNRLFFPHVRKPGRYWGDQQLSNRTAHASTSSSPDANGIIFLVPRSYERGYHHPRLHSLLTHGENQGISFERCYLYEADALALLREHKLPPVTLTTHRPINGAQVILAILDEPSELIALSVMLEAAGIEPLRSARRATQPIILLAGQLGWTPALGLEFADGVFITSSDSSVVSTLAQLENCPDRESRLGLLSASSALFTTTPDRKNIHRWLSSGEAESTAPGATKFVIPLVETSRDSYPTELWRSGTDRLFPVIPVTRGEGSLAMQAVSQHLAHFKMSGMAAMDIAPCADADPHLLAVALRSLARQLDATELSLQLPPLQPEVCTPELLEPLSRLKRPPLHLLAVTGSLRLRQLLGLGDLLQIERAIATAFEKNWRQVSLTFWIGLPTETEQDLQATVELIHRLARLITHPGKHSLVIQLRPFVPVPHTPFQWDALATLEQVQEFARRFGRKGASGVQLRVDDRIDALVTTALRRMTPSAAAELIQCLSTRYISNMNTVEFNRPELLGIPVDLLLTEEEKKLLHAECGALSFTKSLPWAQLEMTESIASLQSHRTSGASSLSRRSEQNPKQITERAERTVSASAFGRDKKRLPSRTLSAPTRNRIRFQMQRGEELRYLSHLDFLRLIERAIRRAQLPVAYSGEEHRLMKLSFGPPLPVGATSACELFEITLEAISCPAIIENFAKGLPAGLSIVSAQVVYGREESLSAAINRAEYQLPLREWSNPLELAQNVNSVVSQEKIEIEREGKQGIKRVDIRPAIRKLSIDENFLTMVLCLEEGRYVRPNEVLTLLGSSLRYSIPSLPLHRASLYRESADSVITNGMQV